MTTVHVWRAFTKDSAGGNLAGVVLLRTPLATEQLQKIAHQAGFSETAFIELHPTHQKVRFFTPQKEVALCGHATIASYAFLFTQKFLQSGAHRMECKAGPQSIHIYADGKVSMSQNLPEFGAVLPPQIITPALGISTADLHPNLPIQIASTGLHKIFVPIRSLKALRSIIPNHDSITDISVTHGAIGMYCYTLETLHNSTAHCRNFAPVVGIFEDSATGTSAAALGTLLFHFDVLPQKHPLELVFEQGYQIKEPSELWVQLEHNGRSIQKVRVEGYACAR